LHGLAVAQHHLAVLPDLGEVVPTADVPGIPSFLKLPNGGSDGQPVFLSQPFERGFLGDPDGIVIDRCRRLVG